MGDGKERDSASAPLRERVRSALGVVRQQGAASLRGVRRSAAGATERLKSTQAAERLGAAVETRRAIKKAADAQRRGNHPMAYRILESEVRSSPDDARVVAAFWNAAMACERAEDAVPAMLRIIRKLASSGDPERAADLWMELRGASPSALVDPSSLVRMLPALESKGRLEQITLALRDTVDPRNESGLSPGLAGRVAEMARQLDPPTALTAARRALTSPDLHETKRARLEELVAELEKTESAAASAGGPSGEPVQKPAAAPAEKPATAQAQMPAAAPAQKPAAAQAQKPAAAQAQKPAAAAAEKPATAQAQMPAAAPAQKPAAASAPKPDAAPVPKPAAAPSRKPAAAPAQKPAAAQAQKPAAAPAQKPAAAPSAAPEPAAEAPDEEPFATPADKPATAQAQKPAAAPAAAPEPAAEAPDEEPFATPADKPATARAQKPAAAPAKIAERPPAAPAAAEVTERAVEDALEALAPTTRFNGIKVTEGMPTKLREEAIALQLVAGRKVGIEYSKIDAVAVAQVNGLADHPVVVIDLVLNWNEQGDSTLRVARLRSDGFDPRMVLEAPDDPAEALRSFLSEILVRSGAVALPDSDAVLGVNRRSFDDLESYQREVLSVASA